MAVYHILLLEFKPTTHHATVEEVRTTAITDFYLMLRDNQTCKKLLALADDCIHPTTKKPYMKSSVGGRDNSPQGHQVVARPIVLLPESSY